MLAELWEQENLKQITLRSRYGLHWRLEWDWEQKRLGDLGTYMVNIKSKLIIKIKKNDPEIHSEFENNWLSEQ